MEINMKIKMLLDAKGSANISGNAIKQYKRDEIIECNEAWQVNLAHVFVSEGFAIEVKMVEPTEKKKTVKKKVTKKAE
tara:strand:+ start:38 stop:271 length:234 start_codon:yes stop_codon:yes gene_type:complete